MLIEYVWIKDQGILKGQGVQFNPNVRYDYYPEKYTLSRKVNKDDAQVPDDFFHIADKADTRIARVTALVGANGTGKTAVLEFLASFLAAKDRSACQGIMVTTQGTFINLAGESEIVFEGEWTGEAEGYKKVRGGDALDVPLTWHVIHFQGEINLDSLGRLIELRRDYFRYNKNFYVDISDRNDMYSHKYFKYLRYNLDSHEYFEYLRSVETLDFIELIKDRKKMIPFSIDHLKVEISLTDHYNYDFEIIMKDVRRVYIKTYTDLLIPLYDLFEQKLKSDLDSTEKNQKIDIIFFHNIFLKYLSSVLLRLLNNQVTEQEFIDNLNTISEYFSKEGKYIEQLKACLTNKYPEFFDYYNELKEIFIEIGHSYTDESIDVINFLNIKIIRGHRIPNFAVLWPPRKIELRRILISQILRFTLSGLSEGEHQFLKLFSWLKEKGTRESTIILLDGFETGFHPEWQRKFLDTWIKFWEGGSYATKVQVILATHSPYIVSDLPKPCVAFLSRKEGESESQVDDPEKHPATLGANLFELYQNAFFMKGALMGDLAKTKIDALFKVLSDPDSKLEEVEPLKNTIRLVGEPLIRMKLWELYYLKTNVPSERAQLLAQSDYIQKRLKDLDNDSNQ